MQRKRCLFRFLSGFLSVMLLLSCLPLSVAAQEETETPEETTTTEETTAEEIEAAEESPAQTNETEPVEETQDSEASEEETEGGSAAILDEDEEDAIMAASEEDEIPPLSVEGDAVVKLDVDATYPWKYSVTYSDDTHVAYAAGNSGSTGKNVSNLAITVAGTGVLSFYYKLSTPSSGKSYAFYYKIGAAITSSNYTSADNAENYKNYRGDRGYWESASITITEKDLDSNGQATVYLAYYRGDTGTGNGNYVAVANVKYVAGERALTITGASEGLGTVAVNKKTTETVTETTETTDPETGETATTTTTKKVDVYTPYEQEDGAYQIGTGDLVYLTATPETGNQFYGWVDTDSGTYLSGEATYSFTFGGATNLKAVFAAENTYTARRGSVFYSDDEGGLTKALSDAQSGDTVVMLASQTLSESVTVKDGVFLLLPCMDSDVGYITTSGITHSPDGTGVYNTENTLYAQLTIPSGVTLTVEGEVLVNAQVGRPAGGDYDQDVNGNYAQIALEGNLIVSNGGRLENYGYIIGGGQVTAQSGSTLVDLYVVTDWRGGSQAYAMVISAEHKVYPMNEFDCHNIQTTVRIESGASFQGAVRMYAGSIFSYTRFPQVDDENGLIRLADGAYLIKTYDPSYEVDGHVEGRSTVEIYGGATFAYSALPIVGVSVSTQSYLFPIDGDIALKLYKGVYTIQNDFKLMPGCTVDLMEGAELTVGPEVTDEELAPDADGIATLVLYDEFNDKPNTGSSQYPTYRPAATLTVHGGASLTVDAKGAIAGRIVLADGATKDKYAKVRLNSKTALTVTSYEANGYYTYTTLDENGKAVTVTKSELTIPLTFTAQLWDADGTQSSLTPKAGTVYYGVGTSWTTTSPVVLPGDLDGNNEVNGQDLAMLLENFNKSGNDLKGDIDDNGEVNGQDLATLLENFNKALSD